MMLLLVCAGGIWFLIPNPALSPEAIILPANYSIKPPRVPIPDRWIPLTWGWLWRMRDALLGRLAVIDVDTRIVRLAEDSNPVLAAALSRHAPLAETNGVRAWMLPDHELRALRRQLEEIEGYEAIASPMMTSAHTVQANLSQTITVTIGDAQLPAGAILNCLTFARGKTADLTIGITHSEAVKDSAAKADAAVLANATHLHTNLTLAAKMRFPPGTGAFLLDMNHADPRGRRVGVFISSKVQ